MFAQSPTFAQKPLIDHLYTADPSVHVWQDTVYIYPSHDIESATRYEDEGGDFVMRDYHVFSMKGVGEPVTDHGVALRLEDIPWAERQLWAPDAAKKNGRYYLYFPAKDQQGVFRIGVASSEQPTGPFTPQAQPIAGTYSNDPAVFEDDTGQFYLYLGGLGGGQLQRWHSAGYSNTDHYPQDDAPALRPRVARLSEDMTSLAEPLREIDILYPDGTPIKASDHDKRFFEGAWVHKYQNTYYLSYATGNTHNIVYATGDNPYGPFVYQGVLLEPVQGWTTQHAIVEIHQQWYLFYHDTELSNNTTHLRNVKVMPFSYNSDGSISPLSAFR